MPYTYLGPAETAWARHLDGIRRKRSLSASALFEELYEAIGLGRKSLTSFKPVLTNKPMPAEWVPGLTKLYGTPAETDPEPVSAPTPVADEIAAAIREQTDVFRELIIETQREASEAKRRADLLERLVVSLLAPAVEASPDPAAIRVMREWGEAALANMTSRQPAADPAG